MLNCTSDLKTDFSAIDLAGRSCVVVAVSGGGDSLALLFLLRDFLNQKTDFKPNILAVTVDHCLRPESAEEARQVAQLCADFGVQHRTMRWDGAKPATGISEAARQARQRLLAEAATDAGADLIFLGHTADDLAETTHMRLARGAGRGLAGIAPATLYDRRIWFVRPLLALRRAELREYLRTRSIPWVDDPTNTNPHYERARVRQSLSEEDIVRLRDMASVAAANREALGGEVAHWMRSHVRLCSPGLFRLPWRNMTDLSEEARVYLMRLLLAVAGGASQLPDHTRTRDLVAVLLGGARRATLSRAVVSRHREHLYLYRENRNLPRQKVADGLVWDMRFRVRAPSTDHDFVIGHMGEALASQRDFAEAGLPNSIARAALAAEPIVERADGSEVGTVQLRLERTLSPWVTLIPSFDYEVAAVMSAIVGMANLPEKPWVRHKQG